MKLLTVVGARPQFIKASALSRRLRETTDWVEQIVHTGQHHDPDMSQVFFDELGIPPPHRRLDISGLSHGAMTGRMLEAIEAAIVAEQPDLVVVFGDTNSTLAGALAAAKLHVPVAHVEAGLRSFNKRMPEEINRILTDHVSTLLFCPTEGARRLLAGEGVNAGVHVVGDIMFDATLDAARRARSRSRILADLNLTPKHYAVATLHRAENTDDGKRLAALVAWLEAQARNVPVVLPLHPRTRQALVSHGLAWQRVRAVPPVGYLDMAALLSEAAQVFTDSGGVQKEAYFHRVPCVTLREETEWTETIDAGWNRLWNGPDHLPRREIPDYGTGHAADAIIEIIASWGQSRTVGSRTH